MSTTAAACPACGYKPARSSPVSFAIALVVLSALIGFVASIQFAIGFFLVFGLIGAIVFARK